MKLPLVSKGLGVVAAVGAAASLNAAVVLAPGGAGAIPPTAGALPAWIAYSVHTKADDAGNFTATLESAVTDADLDGNLEFWYRVSNDVGSLSPLFGLGINLGAALPAVTLDAQAGANTADIGILGAGGTQVSFLFTLDPIGPGETSLWAVLIPPKGKEYKLGTVGVLDGTSEDLRAFVLVPEPTTYAGLFALGLAGFAAYRRFRA